jgi:hypothetical protein
MAHILGTARDPLFVLVKIAADEGKPDETRIEAAKCACRYLHPTLSAPGCGTTSPTSPSRRCPLKAKRPTTTITPTTITGNSRAICSV